MQFLAAGKYSRHTPSTQKELEVLGWPADRIRKVLSTYSRGSLIGAVGVPVLCKIARDTLLLPDNVTSPCAGCGILLEHRPTLPPGSGDKLCAFCTLARIELNKGPV
jgi:hypothetical protein